MAGDISWGQAVLIGLVEGLTEFLPVSSTAHMAIVPQLLGQKDPGAAFSAVIQVGAIVAVLVYFWRDLIRYAKGVLRTKTPFGLAPDDTDARLGWYSLLGTLPSLVLGYLLRKQIEGPFRSLYVIAGALILFGLLLWLAEALSQRKKTLEQLSFTDSQAIGWAQALSLIPGVSRSGITMIAGFFRGLDRESATRFSFLLSVPVITAAGIFEFIKDVLPDPNLAQQAVPYTVGFVVSGLSAYAVIHWFLRYVRNHSTAIFIVYRLALGLLLLFLLLTGQITDSAVTAPAPATSPRTIRTSAD